MYLNRRQIARATADQPVRVGLIGAGKFGSMFLSQVPTTAGLQVTYIADLRPDNARSACLTVGWPKALVEKTCFTDDAFSMMASGQVDVVVEATGNPIAGIRHAREAIKQGLHIIMVNVEADVLAGVSLSKQAEAAGVVYSMAYGDQPALTIEMVEWARATGFDVVAAGKGTKYLPSYHGSTPDTVWDHYGMTAEQAQMAGMNSQMFNSFLDGTKSALEMAAISNATGLVASTGGLKFVPAGMDDLAHSLRPKLQGGLLDTKGQVEVVSSLERDGRPVYKDLRWGVYVVIEAPNDYAAACFRQYGMNTDSSGRYSAMYKPFHLIGLELNISIFSAALFGEATGRTTGFVSDVVATAKRPLKAGEMLDGEGGYTVWGRLCPADEALSRRSLPIGLAHHVRLKHDIVEGAVVSWDDVDIDLSDDIVSFRKKMEAEALATKITTTP